MHCPKPILLLLSFVIFAPADLKARTPEEVVTESMEMLQAGDIDGYCEHFGPTAAKDIAAVMDLMVAEAKEDGDLSTLQQFFGEDATLAAIAKMTALDKLKAFFGAVLAMVDDATFTEFKVLGSVPEGDDLRHAVVRMVVEVEEMKMDAVEVVPLERVGDSWKMMLKADMAGMLKGMSTQFGGDDD